MPQNYLPLQPTDSLQASRLILNNNYEALISNFEGTSFPTLNLWSGMKCYRSDQQTMYTLRTLSPVTWIVTEKLTEVYMTRQDADLRYHRLDVVGAGNLSISGPAAGGGDIASINLHPFGVATPVWQMSKDAGNAFLLNRFNISGVFQDTPLSIVFATGELQSKGNKVWHAGNDGSGSGLDADLVRNTAPGAFGLAFFQHATLNDALSALGLGNGLGNPGDFKLRYGTDNQTGWVFANGLTVGNASSTATGRANNDCENVFKHLWTTNSGLVVAPGGRGASADADWAANKTIATPDARGRALFGRDQMGNTSAAGRLLAAIIAAGAVDQIGSSGGAAMVTLDNTTMPSHSHTGYTDSQGAHQHGVPGGSAMTSTSGTPGVFVAQTTYVYTDVAGAHTHNVYTYAVGGGNAHQNMPPFLLVSVYIKL